MLSWFPHSFIKLAALRHTTDLVCVCVHFDFKLLARNFTEARLNGLQMFPLC